MQVNFNKILTQLCTELQSKPNFVNAAITLLDDGATVPFIARYRKELTGAMDDVQLRLLSERLPYLRELEARRIAIHAEIDSQGKMTAELAAAIAHADSKQRLEDLYAPYKPKRRTKAQIAREAGLEPLAQALLNNRQLSPEAEAGAYLNAEHAIHTVKDALNGARDILAEQFAENADAVGVLRQTLWDKAHLVAKKTEPYAGKASTAEIEKFRDYFAHHEAISRCAPHRALAMLRGQAQDILQLGLELPELIDADTPANTPHPCEGLLAVALKLALSNAPADAFIRDCVRWAWRVKLSTHLHTELLTQLKDHAQREAIAVFARNVRDVLLAAPAGAKTVMGLDPGIRTGVKVAVISPTGTVLATDTVYPFEPRRDVEGCLHRLAQLVSTHGVDLIAIGNGTASRETDALCRELLSRIKQAHDAQKLPQKVTVSEAGASVYSASALASAELPELDVSLRGAVSIARRLQDPLAELVKIDPKSIGVGQYQHDLSDRALSTSLNAVVEDCVNAVGVDVNTASAPLLAQVSGLSSSAAKAIVAYRDEHGAFTDRISLKRVPRLGDKAFEQAAGFLRISGGTNPLDASSVHPESYGVVEKMLSSLKQPIHAVLGRGDVLSTIKPQDWVSAQFGLPTIKDILAELHKPGRDPRGHFEYATFSDSVHDISDLKPGQSLQGVVTNVAAFGAFVDIGVHQDGLVHISELADTFVKDPYSVVKAGQTVKVRVLDVDAARKRISLSMKSSAAGQTSASSNSRAHPSRKADSSTRQPQPHSHQGKTRQGQVQAQQPQTAMSIAMAKLHQR